MPALNRRARSERRLLTGYLGRAGIFPQFSGAASDLIGDELLERAGDVIRPRLWQLITSDLR
jgi:hypothetical protein